MPPVLYSAEDIRTRLKALAKTLAALPDRPQVAAPILVGAFVFAADLVRALAEEGVHLETEMIWLRSYGNARTGSALSVLAAPSEHVKGKHVLLIDGVLDRGHTMARASKLLLEAGAATVRKVVVVDKLHDDAVTRADHALFPGVKDFIVGYGMDDAGRYRALPYIGQVTS
ncbi:MAG TPA: phosphoribosyltransferase family protein [Rhizomicrobium sp.]|jgi:hypoxanthine phosphoribosyltransferase|nr:phosphoribosyltransferase family protein [Rhizomicrobium sp.]